MKIKTRNGLVLIMVGGGGGRSASNERVATVQNHVLCLSVYLVKYRIFLSLFLQVRKQLCFHLILFISIADKRVTLMLGHASCM